MALYTLELVRSHNNCTRCQFVISVLIHFDVLSFWRGKLYVTKVRQFSGNQNKLMTLVALFTPEEAGAIVMQLYRFCGLDNPYSLTLYGHIDVIVESPLFRTTSINQRSSCWRAQVVRALHR